LYRDPAGPRTSLGPVFSVIVVRIIVVRRRHCNLLPAASKDA
jgi:hypothetical protein